MDDPVGATGGAGASRAGGSRDGDGTATIVEGSTTRSGVAIRYLDNAPVAPTGLPILFSPGFTDFADEYAGVLELIAPRRAIVVEVRGRGGSASPPTGYTAADHADDLAAVLAEEGVDRFHLMTFSRGTTWGLDLVLADSRRVASVSIGDYRAGEIGLHVSVAEQVISGRFRGLPLLERVQAHVPRELFRASRSRDLSPALAATGLPVLVATGTRDGCMLDAASLTEYREQIPNLEIVTIDDASHDLFRPDPAAYPRAVLDFISRRAPGT